MIKSLWLLIKSLCKRELRQGNADDFMKRILNKEGLGWIMQPEHTYLDYSNIVYREEVVGVVLTKNRVDLFDHGELEGALAHFVIRTLKQSPDSIWRKC